MRIAYLGPQGTFTEVALLNMSAEGMLPGGAAATEVAGRSAMALTDPGATFVIVDLDGITGEEGRVLSVVWLAPPQGTDAGALVVDLAEAALAAL